MGEWQLDAHVRIYTLKVAWLRVLDSWGTGEHFIVHCVWTWRWDEVSGSSQRSALRDPYPTWEEWAWLVGPHTLGLEPGRTIPFTWWNKPDRKDQTYPQERVTGKQVRGGPYRKGGLRRGRRSGHQKEGDLGKVTAESSRLRASVAAGRIRWTPTQCQNIELIKATLVLRGGGGHWSNNLFIQASKD